MFGDDTAASNPEGPDIEEREGPSCRAPPLSSMSRSCRHRGPAPGWYPGQRLSCVCLPRRRRSGRWSPRPGTARRRFWPSGPNGTSVPRPGFPSTTVTTTPPCWSVTSPRRSIVSSRSTPSSNARWRLRGWSPPAEYFRSSRRSSHRGADLFPGHRPSRGASTISSPSMPSSSWLCTFPTGSQLAVASRTELPLPMARLRAQGHVVEVGVDELAMGDGGGAGAARRG